MFLVVASNFFNKISTVFCVAVTLPRLIQKMRESLFLGGVFHVVTVGPKKKMARVYTEAIVASVAYEHPIRDFSISYLVCVAVGHLHWVGVRNPPIPPVRASWSYPFPATVIQYFVHTNPAASPVFQGTSSTTYRGVPRLPLLLPLLVPLPLGFVPVHQFLCKPLHRVGFKLSRRRVFADQSLDVLPDVRSFVH